LDLCLVHPEIPHNTGCAARLCAATHNVLHLVEPLGFSLEDRYLKRAGLDYWPQVELVVHRDWNALVAHLGTKSARPVAERLRLFTARGGSSLFATPFEPDDVLVFGCEARGCQELVDDAPCYDARRARCAQPEPRTSMPRPVHRDGARRVPLPDNDGTYRRIR
jgi:tRNA (cytidine/uridine-2'-O-)-methyltransferase